MGLNALKKQCDSDLVGHWSKLVAVSLFFRFQKIYIYRPAQPLCKSAYINRESKHYTTLAKAHMIQKNNSKRNKEVRTSSTPSHEPSSPKLKALLFEQPCQQNATQGLKTPSVCYRKKKETILTLLLSLQLIHLKLGPRPVPDLVSENCT